MLIRYSQSILIIFHRLRVDVPHLISHLLSTAQLLSRSKLLSSYLFRKQYRSAFQRSAKNIYGRQLHNEIQATLNSRHKVSCSVQFNFYTPYSSAWRERDTLQRLQNKAKNQLCLPTSFPGSFILLGQGDERPWERRRCACIERPCERGCCACMCLPGDIVNRNRKSLICYNLSVVM